MVSSFGKKAAQAKDKAATPRLVVAETGKILYANAEFAQLCDKAEEDLTGAFLLTLMQFEEADDAFRGNHLFHGHSESQILSGLMDGEHSVRLGKNKNALPLQFDWVETSDDRRFLVVSTAGHSAEEEDFILPQLTDAGSAKDITYFDAEEAGELSHLLDMSHEILCLLDEDGRFLRTNDTFCALLRTDSAILQKKTFFNLVHPDDKAIVRKTLHDLRGEDLEGHIVEFECRMIAADGDVLTVDWRHKRVGDQTYCVGHDLTAIKRHENVLRRKERELTEAEAIGKMGHWYWRLGQDVFIWSDEIYRIFGTRPGEFSPTLDTVNAMVHDGDQDRILQVFQRAMIENKDYEMDLRVIRPDGAACYVRIQGRCETDEDGDVIALYGIMQDITGDTLREQDLREAKEAAERAYAAKSQFLANMSHELRTPLNAIIGFSEMIQNQLLGPVGNERYLEYIKGIRESGEHLLDLISDILDMSKIEAGKYNLMLEQCNVAKIIRMAIHMMEGRAIDSSIKIIACLDTEDMQAVCDRRALMQIILNLVSNAVKFSPENSTIKVHCAEENGLYKIAVEDHGIGIPAHKLASITNPFEQVSSSYSREHEGSGLGLSITKELIEMHGGSMDIQSVLNQGTTVTLFLPKEAKRS